MTTRPRSRKVMLSTSFLQKQYPQFVPERHCRQGNIQRIFTIDFDPEIPPNVSKAILAAIFDKFHHVCICHENTTLGNIQKMTTAEEDANTKLETAIRSYPSILVVGSPEVHHERKKHWLTLMATSDDSGILYRGKYYDGVYIKSENATFSCVQVPRKLKLVYKTSASEQENITQLSAAVSSHVRKCS